jgi:hypothetical protein
VNQETTPETGKALALDLLTFRVTGEVGDGFTIVRDLVKDNAKASRVFRKSSSIRCEDDVDEAVSEVSESVYQYLSSKDFCDALAVIKCAKKTIGYRAINYVVQREKEIKRKKKVDLMIQNSMATEADFTESIDKLLDLKDAVLKLVFAIPVNEFVWQCLTIRHSYTVRELQDFIGVSYRQAINIHNTLSEFFRRRTNAV